MTMYDKEFGQVANSPLCFLHVCTFFRIFPVRERSPSRNLFDAERRESAVVKRSAIRQTSMIGRQVDAQSIGPRLPPIIVVCRTCHRASSHDAAQ